MKEKKYRITLTEHQLMLIANCVEDCHRFAAGQTEMNNTLIYANFDYEWRTRKHLKEIHEIAFPELLPGQSYDWSGNGCKDKYKRKFIAETYPIYREIFHKILNVGVYMHPTMTCEEGGPLPIIEEINE